MNPIRIIFSLVLVVSFSINQSNAQVASSDSLFLVDFYNSTNGSDWNNDLNWLTANPVSTWFGVSVVDWNGVFRVSAIELNGNNVTGTIPADINGLAALERFDIFTNGVGGSFPNITSLDRLEYLDLGRNLFTSIGAMPTPINVLETFYCDQNQLTDLPDLSGLDDLNLFWCNDNRLTFEDVGPYVGDFIDYSYAPQADLDPQTIYIPFGSFINLFIFVDNYPNLVYDWFFGGANVHTGTFYGLSNVSEIDDGIYTIEVTHPSVPGLTITGFIDLVVLFQDNNGGQFNPQQFMVQFEDGADPANIAALETLLISEGAFKIKDCMCGDRLQLWGASTAFDVEERRQTAEDQLDVDSTGTNYLVNIMPLQEGEGPVTSWAPPNTPTGANPVKIAVIDTGIDPENIDIKDFIWTNDDEQVAMTDDDLNCYIDDEVGYDFFNERTDPIDLNGHGTHVSGLILRDYPANVAAELMNLKVHTGEIGFLFDAACAMRYAIDKQADVMNLSFGYYGDRSYILESAVTDAESADIVLVASAGNGIDDSGVDTDINFHWPSSFENNNMITVGALNPDLNDLATYSNFGPNSIDICAPGSLIESTHLSNGFVILSGTSMAAGLVTRTASVIRGLYPSRNAYEVISCILNTAEFTPNLDGKILTSGQLNHGNAINDCLVISTENIPEREMKIFPQPFADMVTIQLDNVIPGAVEFEIYDTFGQLIFRQNLENIERIDWNGTTLSGNIAPSGAYPFLLKTKEGQHSGILIKLVND
ncbi:MAG: S8 family serine peptidase [Bacteroidota bacterium]